jgi:protein SCO1/2
MSGRIWVVDFFYTTCPGPCPALTSRLSEVHRAFAGDARVGFLSISSDPVKDTPEVLRRYAERFKADKRWLFLTGDESAVFKLANEGFKMGIAKVEGAPEPVTHSTKLALVDESGMVRGFFEGVGEEDGTGKGRRELVKCIQYLLSNQPVKK